MLHALGDQLVGRTVLTCTTKMGADQTRDRRLLIGPRDHEVVEAAVREPVLVWRGVEGSKALGVDPEDCDRWFGLVDNLVTEADGARRRPFKAPKPYEPVVPATVTTMISVIGVDALGRVIADQCHRPMRVAALAGCSPYVRLTPEAAAVVLLHPEGARRALPDKARLVVAITKVNDATASFASDLEAELQQREPALTVLRIAFDPMIAGSGH